MDDKIGIIKETTNDDGTKTLSWEKHKDGTREEYGDFYEAMMRAAQRSCITEADVIYYPLSIATEEVVSN
jgi:hypothetical protein